MGDVVIDALLMPLPSRCLAHGQLVAVTAKKKTASRPTQTQPMQNWLVLLNITSSLWLDVCF